MYSLARAWFLWPHVLKLIKRHTETYCLSVVFNAADTTSRNIVYEYQFGCQLPLQQLRLRSIHISPRGEES